jgi:hypothetical protein
MKNATNMTYTQTQIDKAKANYNSFIQYRTVESFEPQYIGWNTAEQRCQYHNNIVAAILAGDKQVERQWKMFFLNEVVKSDAKAAASKAKLDANKNASADILAPIKEAKRLVEFGKWLNTPGNPFRKEHFSKKYTEKSVSTFLNK